MTQKPPKYYVYCSGKTGGMTLYKSLKYYDYDYCIHTHSIAQYNKAKNYIFYENLQPKDLILKSKSMYSKIYIIDSYREPIERSIASFFENIDKHVPGFEGRTIEELIEIYNKNKLYKIEDYHSYYEPFGFFDLSTDITFDHKKKYNITEHENIVFVKLRLKDSAKWEEILKTLISNKIKLLSENIGDNKPTGKLYRLFKKMYKVPKDYLDDLEYNKNNINAIEMKKMLTPEEIKEYFSKWRKRIC